MLVVTRKTDESLTISDNIEITVLEIGMLDQRQDRNLRTEGCKDNPQ